jgi:hypothetical protein
MKFVATKTAELAQLPRASRPKIGERQRTEQEHADTYGWFSRNQKSAGALYAAILGPGSPPIQQGIRPFADNEVTFVTHTSATDVFDPEDHNNVVDSPTAATSVLVINPS